MLDAIIIIIIIHMVFSATVQFISTYRNEISHIEHSIAGVAVGGLAGYFSIDFKALAIDKSVERTLAFGGRHSPIFLALVGLGVGNVIAAIKIRTPSGTRLKTR